MNTLEILNAQSKTLTDALEIFNVLSPFKIRSDAESANKFERALRAAELTLGGYSPLGTVGSHLRFTLTEYATACERLAEALEDAVAPEDPEEVPESEPAAETAA